MSAVLLQGAERGAGNILLQACLQVALQCLKIDLNSLHWT